jgi:hypothetical protein
MNPVHKGHVQMLHQARERLEAAGYNVIGAYLSPTHDRYLQPKASSLGTIGLTGPFRVEVAKRAAQGDDFVAISDWEVAQSRFVDFPEVAQTLQSHVGDSAKVFYVAGTDHASRCGITDGSFRYGISLVIVPREGEAVPSEIPGKVFLAQPGGGEVAAYSSTKVRNALKQGDLDYVSRAMSPEAAKFLLQPEPAERTQYSVDFDNISR